jgi:cysteine desulfurase
MKINIIIAIIVVLILIKLWYLDPVNFDANAGTPMPLSVKFSMMIAPDGNPSGKWNSREKSIIEKLKQLVISKCGPGFKCIITSGSSESNHLALRGIGGHVIVSDVEHKTTIEWPGNKTVVKPEIDAIVRAIRPDTKLVSIMAANNETGLLYDIRAIGNKIREINNNRANKIWFHSDVTQFWGRNVDLSIYQSVDMMSISMHKLYGPKGVGFLVVRNELYDSSTLEPQITGSQNNGMRGGTENVVGCAGAITAINHNFNNRINKNLHLLDLKNRCLAYISTQMPVRDIMGFRSVSETPGWAAYIFMKPTLPNTLMISFTNSKRRVCNINLRKNLWNQGFIVSIGSACNTANSKPSHVLIAHKLPYHIRCGVIRISFSDNNTVWQVNRFCQILMDCLSDCLVDY